MDWLLGNWALVALGLVSLSAWLRGRLQAETWRVLLEQHAAMQRAVLALAFIHKGPKAHAALLQRESARSSDGDSMVPTAQEDLERFVNKALGPTY